MTGFLETRQLVRLFFVHAPKTQPYSETYLYTKQNKPFVVQTKQTGAIQHKQM